MDNNTTSKETLETCVSFPPHQYSLGFFGGDVPFDYSLATLETQIIAIFILTQLVNHPLKKIRFPKLIAEMIVGVLLGPTMPRMVTQITTKLFPEDTQSNITTLSMFGYTFMLFLIGVKSDVSLITKTGKGPILIAISCLIIPFTIGSIFLAQLGLNDTSANAVLAVYCLTPFSGMALLLKDLNLLNSELGRLALSSGVISEPVNVSLIFLFNNIQSFKETGSLNTLVLNYGFLALFLLVAFFVIRPTMIRIGKKTPEYGDLRNEYLIMAVLVTLVGCICTHMMDQYVMLGAFVMGLAMPDGPPIGSSLVTYLDAFISGIIVPTFVTVATSRADLSTLVTSDLTSSLSIIIPTVFLVKLGSVVISASISKVPVKDSILLGLVMSTKGIVELSAYTVCRDNGIIDEFGMSVGIVSIAVTCLVSTLSVRKYYDPKRKYGGYQIRDIMHTKMNSELRILACLHRPDNINGFINFIDTSGPTKETPMALSALHLIELRGRANPIFISHELQQRSATNSNVSYSEDILISFFQFRRRKVGAVSVECYTAITPRVLMHDDICTLALDKLTSLIIIPFHRRWEVQGFIDPEDNSLRTLNKKILDRSPCSVGILVDRGHVGKESSNSVAMIFMGGKDDREALAYAKRIARNSSITLTVIHLVAEDPKVTDQSEKLIDIGYTLDLKIKNIETQYINYIEEKVKDGPETAVIVRNMINDYDLIIVGKGPDNDERPQISGLGEWSEFPELGVLGDFLVSLEGKCRASSLIIQQQKQAT